MATVNELSATARPKAGKGAARAVRREGRVPGVIYGDSKEPVTISLDFRELRQKIYAGHFLTTVFNVDVDGTKVLARDCAASIKRWGARDGFGQALMAATDEISASDDTTILFRLKVPFPLLRYSQFVASIPRFVTKRSRKPSLS